MWATRPSSEQREGPRRLGSGRCSMGRVARRRWKQAVERGRSQRRQTRARPYLCPVEGEAVRPTASASSERKGGRPGSAGQQFGVHGQLADLRPQPGDLVVPVVGRSALQRGLTGSQEVLTPA